MSFLSFLAWLFGYTSLGSLSLGGDHVQIDEIDPAGMTIDEAPVEGGYDGKKHQGRPVNNINNSI